MCAALDCRFPYIHAPMPMQPKISPAKRMGPHESVLVFLRSSWS